MPDPVNHQPIPVVIGTDNPDAIVVTVDQPIPIQFASSPQDAAVVCPITTSSFTGIPQTVVIPVPADFDDIPLFRTYQETEVTQIIAVIRSSGADSVTARIGYAPGIEDVISNWVTPSFSVTDQSAGQAITISTPIIPANMQARLVITAVSSAFIKDLTLYMRGNPTG